MISKELLSAVLGVEVTNVRDTMYDNELRFETPDEELRRKFSPYVPKINIYELGFKCKEWSWNNGYQIRTSYKSVTMTSRPYGELISCKPIEIETVNDIMDTSVMYSMVASYGGEDDETEIDVIIRLSEWVLEKLKDDDANK